MSPPTPQLIPLAAQPLVPWRNGGGSTREIAAEPRGARASDPFTWRVSIATVASDGPFSAFPGINRSLWLLSGHGMLLTVDGIDVRLDQPCMRIDFPGEARVGARLLDGPTQDLNLMTARGRGHAVAEVVTLAAGQTWRRANALSGTDLLVALDGRLRTEHQDLQPGDALRLDASAARTWDLQATNPATFLFATLAPHP